MAKKISLPLVCMSLFMFLFVLAGCAKMQAPGDDSAPAQETREAQAPAPAAAEPVVPASARVEPPARARDPAPSTQPYAPPSSTAPAVQPSPTPAAAVSAGAYADPKVAALVQKARDKVESYSFLYQTSGNWDVIRDKYFIHKNKMKIDLYDVNLYNRRNYFDMVYLDMSAKTGVAYCEDRRHQRCIDPDRRFDIAYEDFIIKTPKEWMLSMPPDAHVISSEMLDERLATVIEHTNPDGTVTRLWVDTFSGLPMQVSTYQGEIENSLERYGFRDLSVNSVLSSQVEHQ